MIRLARAADAPFIRELATLAILHSVPPTREVAPEAVQRHVTDNYDKLEEWLGKDRNFAVLLAEDPETRQPVGYLMLELNQVEPSTGEKQGFIVDLAVLPDKRGHFATRKLIRKASQLCKARGLKYLVAMVSVNNERVIGLGKALNFQLERVQLVRKL